MGDFRQINSTLKNILGRYSLDEAYQEQVILKFWNTKMDKKIAGIASPKKLEHGKLVLHAQSSLWRKEIKNNLESLLSKIHKTFPDITINKIEIV